MDQLFGSTIDIASAGNHIQSVLKVLFMFVNLFMSTKWFVSTYTGHSYLYVLGVVGSLIMGYISK